MESRLSQCDSSGQSCRQWLGLQGLVTSVPPIWSQRLRSFLPEVCSIVGASPVSRISHRCLQLDLHLPHAFLGALEAEAFRFEVLWRLRRFALANQRPVQELVGPRSSTGPVTSFLCAVSGLRSHFVTLWLGQF